LTIGLGRNETLATNNVYTLQKTSFKHPLFKAYVMFGAYNAHHFIFPNTTLIYAHCKRLTKPKAKVLVKA
jgi:hypothetical protein